MCVRACVRVCVNVCVCVHVRVRARARVFVSIRAHMLALFCVFVFVWGGGGCGGRGKGPIIILSGSPPISSLCPVSPHIWNSLPEDLRHCSTLPSFKAKLKTFFFSQYFHPN